jgi:hypothetical protein
MKNETKTVKGNKLNKKTKLQIREYAEYIVHDWNATGDWHEMFHETFADYGDIEWLKKIYSEYLGQGEYPTNEAGEVCEYEISDAICETVLDLGDEFLEFSDMWFDWLCHTYNKDSWDEKYSSYLNNSEKYDLWSEDDKEFYYYETGNAITDSQKIRDKAENSWNKATTDFRLALIKYEKACAKAGKAVSSLPVSEQAEFFHSNDKWPTIAYLTVNSQYECLTNLGLSMKDAEQVIKEHGHNVIKSLRKEAA